MNARGISTPGATTLELPGSSSWDTTTARRDFRASSSRGSRPYGAKATFHDRAQAARADLAVDGLAGNGAQRLLRQREIDRLHLEQPLVLFHQRVLGLGENELERRLVEVLERGHDGQSADEFRDQAVLQQVFRLDLTEDFTGLAVLGRQHLGAEADRGRAPAGGNDLLQAGEGAAAHEQDIGGVDLQEFLLWVLAPALRRHRRDRAFHDLEQGLLHALARDVAGD